MFLKKCIPAIVALLLVACGSDGNNASGPNPSSDAGFVVDTYDDLLVCFDKRDGVKAYVKDEKSPYVCTDDGWVIDYLNIPKEDFLNPKITYGTMTDSRDGQTYKTVKIGDQVWMAENLNYQVDNSFCYNDSAEYCEKFGLLYRWTAAVGKSEAECGYRDKCGLSGKVRGVCPEGWHLPDTTEWITLFTGVGGVCNESNRTSNAGYILKSQMGWLNGRNGTDAYGFSAIPAGISFPKGNVEYHYFNYDGLNAYFWCSDEKYDNNKGYIYAFNIVLDTKKDSVYISHSGKAFGLSVRCVQD